ncbi:hypothetical protein [Paraconexibacter algicola]|uniref:Uncharacterized protein n=1 Tax=Paraconexibacter algicola TaxID=2133960 RepID=A0A2T4UD82_9ACTN|nr:hypothetical protein [Paraconexibacter algicola]PTL55459.1 hypothetical protein C7Y72_17545 [Paraconexibacter algicola]
MRNILLTAPLAAVIALGAAGSAQAGTATLWGCHGPTGAPLGADGLQALGTSGATANTNGAGCSGSGPSDGLRLSFNGNSPTNGTFAAWRITSPGGVTVIGATIERTLSGFGNASAQPAAYRLRSGDAAGTALEQRLTNESGANGQATIAGNAAGNFVEAQLRCDAPATCAVPGGPVVDIRSLALTVNDLNPPNGSIAGLTEPARGVATINVQASDQGLGLQKAELFVDGVLRQATDLAGPACADIAPSRGGNDLPIGVACPKTGNAALAVDTTTLGNGNHRFLVVLTDLSGNAVELLNRDVRVDNSAVQPGSTSVAINIGGALQEGLVGAESLPLTSAPGRCLSPRLTMALSQRPASRDRRGVPIFKKGRRYRFRGKLTCLSNGKRVIAPRGTAIEVVNRIGGRAVSKSGASVRTRGEITWFNPANYTTREIEFRYRPRTGAAARVTQRIIVR